MLLKFLRYGNFSFCNNNCYQYAQVVGGDIFEMIGR